MSIVIDIDHWHVVSIKPGMWFEPGRTRNGPVPDSAANTIGVPTSPPQGFAPFLLRHTDILSCEEDHDFEESWRASFPCLEGEGRWEKTVCQFYASLGRFSRRSATPRAVNDSMEGKVLSQPAWYGVVGIPPPTPKDRQPCINSPFWQPASRSIWPCRMN
jgi:hypothetical protein